MGVGGREVVGALGERGNGGTMGAPARSGGRPKVGVWGGGRRLPVEPRVVAPGATLPTTDAGERTTFV